jgi:hypothetical protein
MKGYRNLVVKAYRSRCITPAKDKNETDTIIRYLADDDECFENLVFELGLRVLRKELLKQDADK